MITTVFFAVIGAALLHAVWNAMVKGGDDKLLGMAGIMLGHGPIALVTVLLSPLPSVESLPFLAGGVVLHFGYQYFLLNSYLIGDLTQVYPIARGVAPLLVAAVSVALLGVDLLRMELLAVVIIGTGIVSLGLVRRADGMRNGAAAMLALVTGGFIASYSLVDGTGVRLSNSSVGYYGWLALGNSVVFALYLAVVSPGTFRRLAGPGRVALVLGGNASFVAYAIVTWAFTQAPIALVSALRETSIVFALLIGVTILREPLNVGKVAATMTTLLGAALLRFARG